jgi:hypothetical protein
VNQGRDLDYFFARIKRGAMTHDDAADMFMQSAIGQSTGVGRAEILAKLHTHFPGRAALASYLRNLLDHFSVVLRA